MLYSFFVEPFKEAAKLSLDLPDCSWGVSVNLAVEVDKPSNLFNSRSEQGIIMGNIHAPVTLFH